MVRAAIGHRVNAAGVRVFTGVAQVTEGIETDNVLRRVEAANRIIDVVVIVSRRSSQCLLQGRLLPTITGLSQFG